MNREEFDPTRLVVGEAYTTAQIAELGGVRSPTIPFSRSDRWSMGVVEFKNHVVLLVTLVKGKGGYEYEDYFDGSLFWWQSQNRQTQASPAIADLIAGQRQALLFIRLRSKTTKGEARPYTYCGRLSVPTVEGENPVTCLFESLDFESRPNANLAEIYHWRPIQPPTPTVIRRQENIRYHAPSSGGGAGRISDPKRRKCVESYAMGRATAHYTALGFAVEDTSKKKPFDLVCTKDGAVRRVEVKGTQSGAETVDVTIGEIRAVREDGVSTDLFIVHSITVSGNGGDLAASGGIERVIADWQPRDEHLVATAFRYTVPETTSAR